MPTLSNGRHELFAQGLAQGKTEEQAYVDAGYKPDRSNANKLTTNHHIVARIAEIQAAGAKRAEITVERVLREMALLGFANSDDYFDWGPGGITLKEAASLTREQKAAVAEVSETKTEHGGTVRVKLHDKKAALYDIGKHLGMFVDRKEIGEPGDFANLTDDQLDKRIDDIDRQVADLEGGKRAAQSGKASQATH